MPKTWDHYQFRSRWEFAAPAGDVFAALAELIDYPTWWPQVRSATMLAEDSWVGRPAFRANHAVMMAAGKRGLAAHASPSIVKSRNLLRVTI